MFSNIDPACVINHPIRGIAITYRDKGKHIITSAIEPTTVTEI